MAAIRSEGCCREIGTYAAPAIMTPSAPMTCRGPLETMTATSSPLPTPAATRPVATARARATSFR